MIGTLLKKSPWETGADFLCLCEHFNPQLKSAIIDYSITASANEHHVNVASICVLRQDPFPHLTRHPVCLLKCNLSLHLTNCLKPIINESQWCLVLDSETSSIWWEREETMRSGSCGILARWHSKADGLRHIIQNPPRQTKWSTRWDSISLLSTLWWGLVL